MGLDTAIAWTDHTINIAFGCQKISPGCKRCYAEGIVRKAGDNLWGPNSERRTFGDRYWDQARQWNDAAKAEGRVHRVFSSSMCDVFEDHPTITAEREKRLWPTIRKTPWLHWQLLTKRAERMRDNLPPDWGTGYPNVWLGVSVESQEYVSRVEILRTVPVHEVRFISYEPALGPIALDLSGIGWVICGGESGEGFRPMPHEWPRAIMAQCRAANVPFFFKQSAAPRTEMGIKLDGQIVREYPTCGKPPYSTPAPTTPAPTVLDGTRLARAQAGKELCEKMMNAVPKGQTGRLF